MLLFVTFCYRSNRTETGESILSFSYLVSVCLHVTIYTFKFSICNSLELDVGFSQHSFWKYCNALFRDSTRRLRAWMGAVLEFSSLVEPTGRSIFTWRLPTSPWLGFGFGKREQHPVLMELEL